MLLQKENTDKEVCEKVVQYFLDREGKNHDIAIVIRAVSNKYKIDEFLTKKAVWYLLSTDQIIMNDDRTLKI